MRWLLFFLFVHERANVKVIIKINEYRAFYLPAAISIVCKIFTSRLCLRRVLHLIYIYVYVCIRVRCKRCNFQFYEKHQKQNKNHQAKKKTRFPSFFTLGVHVFALGFVFTYIHTYIETYIYKKGFSHHSSPLHVR